MRPITDIAWSLDWHGGDTFKLSNEGTKTAFGVTVEAPGMNLPRKHFDEPATIGPGSAVLFMAVPHMGSDRTIVITWHRLPDCSDDPKTIHQPLPSQQR